MGGKTDLKSLLPTGNIGADFKRDAVPFSKGKRKALGIGVKPTVDTSAQDQLLAQQNLDRAKLDEEENRRRKRLFSAAQGARAYRGSPLFRSAPSNTSGGGAAAPAVAATRAGSTGAVGGGGPSGGYARRSFLL